jgi:hypothetical protein
LKVIEAFSSVDLLDEFRDAFFDLVDGSGVGFTQQRFQFRERLLDRVQIRAVGRQEEQFGSGRAYRLAHCLALMTAQVVHHDDVARTHIPHQKLHDPGKKALAIDGAVEHARRDDAITAQTGDEG